MSTPKSTVTETLGKALRLAWPVSLLMLGSLLLATAWGRWPISLLMAAAAALPLLLLRLVIRLGISRWAASSVLVLLVLLGAYLLTAEADLSFSETVRDVVPRLLTSPRPYALRADLLVGPLLLSALVSLFVGLRVESSNRVEPVLGAAVLYVAGALLTGGAADPWGLVAVLILVVAVLGWVFLDEHSEPVGQRFAIAAPLSVVGVGLLAALALLPANNRFEPRELVDPPVVQVVASNPLPQLGAWAANPDTLLLAVRGDRVPLRLVTLDLYDGRQWTAATRFAPIGTGGDTSLPAGRYTREATVEVEFDGLGGNWLPSPGRPTLVGDPDAVIDPGTGTLYTQGTTDDLTYEVTGSFDDPPDEALEAGSIPESDRIRRYTQLPPLDFELADYSARVTRGATTPYAQALAIEDEIRGDNTLSNKAISGSALWRIESFLIGRPGEPGAQIGTSEQFATAFAVVARATGLPTRVVVGFRPGTDQEDGSRVISGRDAFAWPEIYFEDLGWIPFSPTPNDDTFRRDRPEEGQAPGQEDLTGPSLAPTPTPSGPAATPAPETDSSAETPPSSARPWRPYALAAAAAAGIALVLALARWLRRLRHRRRGAPGAWSEVLDALRLSGIPAPPQESAEQLALGVDQRLGIQAASQVATAAERAAFGPGPAPSGRLRPELRTVQRSARRTTPWWRRWWWHLDPRVFVR